MSTAKYSLVATAIFFFLICTVHADNVWHDSLAEATKLAHEQNKDLLLLFTGSDWCVPCQKLEEEILSKPEFIDEAKRSFVLAILDFPREKQLPPETIKQNQEWAQRYGVESYPTVILVDRQQRPYGITGYREGSVEEYLGMLGEFSQKRQRRDEALEKAKGLQGMDRAKMLDQALSEMEQSLAELYYEDIVSEIVEIDKQDIAGLRTKWNESKDSEIRKMIITDILVISRLEKPAAAIGFIDEILEQIKFPASQQLQILQIKLNLLRNSNQLDEMDALLDEMISIPELTEDSRQRLIVKKILSMTGTGRKEAGMQMLQKSIEEAGDNAAHLWLAKGQLHFMEKKYEDAIRSFDTGINRGDPSPDVLIELYGAKADCYMALDNELRAMQTLDKFAEDDGLPADLRAEALLQKAMMMRDSGRKRRATLVENRAIELSQSVDEQAEIRKLVDRLRRKYDGSNVGTAESDD